MNSTTILTLYDREFFTETLCLKNFTQDKKNATFKGSLQPLLPYNI